MLCVYLDRARTVLLSINRYERKKNINLAIEALAKLKAKVVTEDWASLHLVIAGIRCHNQRGL